jgi:hypothetical protein
MRETRPYGSVRGALSNERPCRDIKTLDFVPPELDFVPPGFDCVSAGFDFVPRDLENPPSRRAGPTGSGVAEKGA